MCVSASPPGPSPFCSALLARESVPIKIPVNANALATLICTNQVQVHYGRTQARGERRAGNTEF